MGKGRVQHFARVQWLTGCAWLLLGVSAAYGQQPPAELADLDPTAPLDSMPDLGIDWPDLDRKDAPPPDEEGVSREAVGQQLGDVPRPVSDAGQTRRYRWLIRGLEEVEAEPEIRQGFSERSALESDDDESANAAQVDRRARADSELLAELLRSQGYYDARVDLRIDSTESELLVALEAVPGPRYRFESVELPGLDQAAAGEAERLREAFAVRPGDPVVAQRVIEAGVALQVALGERGFATARVGEQDIVIDHESASARLVLPIAPGPIARFGKIRVSGQPPFSDRHVQRIARFRPGDRFEQSEVADLRRALIATGLVSSLEVQQQPRDSGEVIDLAVRLEPAPMRTIAGEVGYGTGEGVRAEASWQHRNLFNPEGALTVRGVIGTQEQLGAVSFRRNNWLQRDQVLNAQALASHVNRDAYEARTISLSAGFERQSNFIWQKKWTWSLGAELIATDERDTIESTGEDRRRTFFIAALPASLGLDESDNLLDPTRGFRLLGRLSPEISLRGGATQYVRMQIDGSAYHPLSESIVAAGRIRLGSVLGATRDEVAPSRLFYSGGGGSVRGYGYQRIGPRDVDNRPTGGLSLAEFAVEARIRLKMLGGNFGIVPFLDGGTVSAGNRFDLGRWRLGAGLGARYYSSFGPIRIDVGTPLNPQKGDSPVAVVVSLGQAF